MDTFPYKYTISSHEKKIIEFFSKRDQTSWLGNIQSVRKYSEQKPRVLIICFTNRSGSTFLAEALRSTGKLGIGGEFFNFEYVKQFSLKNNINNFVDYCLKLQEQHSLCGIFCTKLGWEQLCFLMRIGILPKVYQSPNYIWVRREDVLSQAISFSIADQNKVWNSNQKAVTDKVKFDWNDINNRLQSIICTNANFDLFFRTQTIRPYKAFYKSFSKNISAEIRQISEWLGLTNVDVDPLHISLKVQRNKLNKEFKKRFLERFASYRSIIEEQEQLEGFPKD